MPTKAALLIRYLAIATVMSCGAFEAGASQDAGWPPDVPIGRNPVGRPTRLPTSIRAIPKSNGAWRCIVSYPGGDDAAQVSLAGSFNGWSTTANPMERSPSGDWIATVDLEDGTHFYNFVEDRDRWVADPANVQRRPRERGVDQTIFWLGPDSMLDPTRGALGDGVVVGAGLRHDPTDWRDLQRLPDGRIRIVAHSLRGDAEAASVAFSDGSTMEMLATVGSEILDAWQADVPADRDGLEYTFLFQDGGRFVRHPELHELDAGDLDRSTPRTPDWAKNAIWYQLMVERFRDGEDANDPTPMRPWTSEWYTPSEWEGKDGSTFYDSFVFGRHYGGDLQGLREKLPYLKELGVDAIYLNPVFQAETHHKYDATDYRHIDEHFGAGDGDFSRTTAAEDLGDPETWTWSASDTIFLETLKAAKELGFRVILDGVFNHVGTRHPAFQDVKERGVESPYADWFSVRSWDPFECDGWAGFDELPAFRKSPEHGLASKTLRDHIFNVTRRWMDPDGDGDPSDGIDGWRLDVPEEIPQAFWMEWCELVRSINPDAYIVGEIWKPAPDWLDGRTFDAVMNYPFADAALAWIAHEEKKISATELDRRLEELRNTYPSEVTYALQNLADSHDTDRLVSKIFNPDRPFEEGNREQDDPTYDGSKPSDHSYRRARLFALLQMTYVGAPMIYYGDEAGMWGSDDPNNRKPMLWKDLEPYDAPEENRVDDEHLQFYRSAIALRRSHAALRVGGFRTVIADDAQDLWVFVREDADEEVLVALNASDSDARFDLPGEGWTPVFGAPDTPSFPGERPETGTPSSVLISGISGRAWVRPR